MRYCLMPILVAVMCSTNSLAGRLKMTDNNIFTISVSCNNEKECQYNNQSEIPVVVTLKNINDKGFYIPLEYVKKTGPSVKLIDKYNQKSMLLKPNLVSWDLRNDLAYIPGNSNVSFSWAILDRDIIPFIKDGGVNIYAEFKIRTKVYNEEKNVIGEFISSSKLAVKGNDLDENK